MINPLDKLSKNTLKKWFKLKDIAAPSCQKILSNNWLGPKILVKTKKLENIKIMYMKKLNFFFHNK